MKRDFDQLMADVKQLHDKLVAMTPVTRDNLGACNYPGVYLFAESGKDLYVGRGKNLKKRIPQHSPTRMTDAPFEVAPRPTTAPRANPWNPSKVPLPTLSAEEAIARVEAYLRNQPTTQEEVLIVAADWTTPKRFKTPRIRGGIDAVNFVFPDPAEGVKWVWLITCVHRIPPAYVWKNPRSQGGKNDGVTLYRVEANGHVDGAFAVGL